jgi:hypothetical protein
MSTINDGLFTTKSVFQPHEERLYAEKTQNNEQAILRENAELRKMEIRPGEWAWPIAKIPSITYDKWLREHPELKSPNKEDRQRKLLQLIQENPQVMVVERLKT